jgi:hypothetical protein
VASATPKHEEQQEEEKVKSEAPKKKEEVGTVAVVAVAEKDPLR